MWQPFDKIDNETKSQMPFEYGIRPVVALKSNIQIDYSLLNFFHFFLASVDLVFFFYSSFKWKSRFRHLHNWISQSCNGSNNNRHCKLHWVLVCVFVCARALAVLLSNKIQTKFVCCHIAGTDGRVVVKSTKSTWFMYVANYFESLVVARREHGMQNISNE